MMSTSNPVLSEDTLRRCAERAASYDRDNRFFAEDYEELSSLGYLTIPVPQELGGRGLSLAEVCREQQHLAYFAPATALAINMHLYWTGVAADLWRAGDRSLEWLLQEAIAGEVFAAGHAEAGNDIPNLYSTAQAQRVEGGYRFTGHKMFGSLTPVWTRLGLHACDASDSRGSHIVHAFLPRGTEGVEIRETWDTLGMRATRSDDTELRNAFVPDRYIARVIPEGVVEEFGLSVFAWALLGFASVYYGIALRAKDLIVDALKKRSSVAMTRPLIYHPEVQHGIAEIVIKIEAMGPHLEKIARDWSDRVDHGGEWPAKIVAAKYHCVEAAWQVVDRAMDLSGGAGMFKRNPLERLFRDARCGRFHPANAALVHEIVGKTALGIDFGERPRWG
jgi:alkylation response protein AidB-like acyl-CoA dehydrogenase